MGRLLYLELLPTFEHSLQLHPKTLNYRLLVTSFCHLCGQIPQNENCKVRNVFYCQCLNLKSVHRGTVRVIVYHPVLVLILALITQHRMVYVTI